MLTQAVRHLTSFLLVATSSLGWGNSRTYQEFSSFMQIIKIFVSWKKVVTEEKEIMSMKSNTESPRRIPLPRKKMR
jgi:hypothetical protein